MGLARPRTLDLRVRQPAAEKAAAAGDQVQVRGSGCHERIKVPISSADPDIDHAYTMSANCPAPLLAQRLDRGYEMSMQQFPPHVTNQHSAGMANAGHGASSGRRIRGAENLAELKAMRGSRFQFVRRLLNRVSRRNG